MHHHRSHKGQSKAINVEAHVLTVGGREKCDSCVPSTQLSRSATEHDNLFCQGVIIFSGLTLVFLPPIMLFCMGEKKITTCCQSLRCFSSDRNAVNFLFCCLLLPCGRLTSHSDAQRTQTPRLKWTFLWNEVKWWWEKNEKVHKQEGHRESRCA